MSLNRFIRDPTSGVIRGQYDENIDTNALHNLVRDVLRKDAAQSLKGVGEDVVTGYKIATSPETVPIETSINFFMGVMKRLDQIPLIETYERRASKWLDAIRIHQGKTRLALIEQYIKLVSTFVPTNIVYANGRDALACPECSQPLTFDDDYCPVCYTQHIKYVSNGVYNDNLEAEPSKPSTVKDPYEKFHVRYLRLQGRYDVQIAPDDLAKIKDHIGKKYCITNTSELMRDENRNIMREVLDQLSMKRYQDDVNLLMYIIWNYPPPDYSAYDSQVEANWRESQAIIEANRKPKDPIGIDNNDWRLCKELQLVGIACVEEDFHITNNKDVKQRQDRLWAIRMKSYKTGATK